MTPRTTDGLSTGEDGVTRCSWSGGDPLNLGYHDEEWGRPVLDDQRLFEKLCLEGFQSGLSWLTILRKRENFRAAFAGFDIAKIARFNQRTVERLMGDAGIVRNRAKIEATINNARRCIELIEDEGSLAAYVWSFEPDPGSRPSTLDWTTLAALGPSPQATAMSKDLKKRGWAFVGPTTLYSMMESVGLVNDHMTTCDAKAEVDAARAAFERPR
jgi:DNA-3-methyladenine glycosylase I